jgi:hypothetical protein
MNAASRQHILDPSCGLAPDDPQRRDRGSAPQWSAHPSADGAGTFIRIIDVIFA